MPNTRTSKRKSFRFKIGQKRSLFKSKRGRAAKNNNTKGKEVFYLKNGLTEGVVLVKDEGMWVVDYHSDWTESHKVFPLNERKKALAYFYELEGRLIAAGYKKVSKYGG